MLRSAVKKFLLNRGIVMTRPPGQFSIVDLKLNAASKRGLKLDCIVDGGAHTGEWTREVKSIYPDATVLAVEPRADVQDDLKRVASELSRIHIAQALLGPSESMVEFHEEGTVSSALPNARGDAFGKSVQMRMSTLDSLIAQHKLPWPDLIKLDLQGFELDALRGAGQCLANAQAVLLELSFFRLLKGAPLAAEVIEFMRQNGFRIYDILGLWHRPLDGALGQGDFLFLKDGHPLVQDESWGVGMQSA